MTVMVEELISDEADFLGKVVPLERARLIELGCGKADLARKLLQAGRIRSVLALEVDAKQHAANVAAPAPRDMSFVRAGAESIPAPDAQFDVAMMLKSLHHVPLPLLDQALAEIRRVLVPGGYLYVSEPVYAGEFNDIVKLFHDEGVVRAAAYEALRRAIAGGSFEDAGEYVFDTALHFVDYDDFVNRIVRVTHSDMSRYDAVAAAVRTRFEPHLTSNGARFVRQMRVNVLRRPQ